MNQHLSRQTLFVIAILVSFCLSIPSLAFAGNIKEQMRARVPVINNLKAEGIVGEDNKGFLEFRKNDPGQQQLVNSANADRRMVYSAIARQQQVNPELVGMRRARQIAAKARPGTWLQNKNGSWYRK